MDIQQSLAGNVIKSPNGYHAGVSVNQNPDDLQDVQNDITALDFGLKRHDDLPLSFSVNK